MSKCLNNLNAVCVLSGVLCLLPFVGGCTRTELVTKNLHYTVVNGNQDPKQFQYYISSPITLKKLHAGSDLEIVDGKIKRHTGKTENIIHFDRHTPCVLVQIRHTTRDGKHEVLRYDVRLEDNPNCELTFGQQSERSSILYLCYSDPAKRTVDYGGVEYYVELPKGDPYLIIKRADGTKSKSKGRIVPGAKL